MLNDLRFSAKVVEGDEILVAHAANRGWCAANFTEPSKILEQIGTLRFVEIGALCHRLRRFGGPFGSLPTVCTVGYRYDIRFADSKSISNEPTGRNERHFNRDGSTLIDVVITAMIDGVTKDVTQCREKRDRRR